MPTLNYAKLTNPRVLQPYEDNGYSKLCLRCSTRSGKMEGLIGRERELVLEVCATCKAKPPRSSYDPLATALGRCL